MYLIGSLLLALGITVFVVSKVAEMLHAKKPGMERILVASLVGSVAAAIALIALGIFVKDLDPMMMMILSVVVMLLVSTAAFKSINVMSWSGAITTNIANITLVLMTGTAAVVLNGVSLDETIKSVQNTFTDNAELAEGIAKGNVDEVIAARAQTEENAEEVAELDEELEPVITELDLLPEATVKEIKAKEKRVYREPKYHVISISNIRSAVGKKVRIKNTKGNNIIGALKSVNGNDAVIERRMGNGLAITPISFAKISKLEVYR